MQWKNLSHKGVISAFLVIWSLLVGSQARAAMGDIVYTYDANNFYQISISHFPPLLLRYEPILYMHPDERFLPMNVEAFVKECSLWIGFDEPTIPDGQVTLDDLGIYQDEDYYLKFVEDLGIFNIPDPDQAFALYDGTTDKKITYYGRVTQDGDYDVLQYWFFYAFNDWGAVSNGFNNHEGDWEMMMIFLKDNIPEYVAYSSHHNKGSLVRRRWDQIEKEGDHPIVYVALGSHANYFTPGDILVRPILRQDHTSDSGLRIGPGQDIEWYHNSEKVFDDCNLPGWVALYKGMWGVDFGLWDIRVPPPEGLPSEEEKIPPHFPTDGPPGPMWSDLTPVGDHHVVESPGWHYPIQWADSPGLVYIIITPQSDSVEQGRVLEVTITLANESSEDYGWVPLILDVLGNIRGLKFLKVGPYQTYQITSRLRIPSRWPLGVYTASITCYDWRCGDQLAKESFNFEVISATVGSAGNKTWGWQILDVRD